LRYLFGGWELYHHGSVCNRRESNFDKGNTKR
jgi:hypothetical protein